MACCYSTTWAVSINVHTSAHNNTCGVLLAYTCMVYFYIFARNRNDTMRRFFKEFYNYSTVPILPLLLWLNVMLIFFFICILVLNRKMLERVIMLVMRVIMCLQTQCSHSERYEETRINKGIKILKCWHWIYGYVWGCPEPILSWS